MLLRTLFSGLLLLTTPLGAAAAPETPPAMEETVVDFHWSWGAHHLGGPVKALIIVNQEAYYEAEALALREDMEVGTLSVRGDAKSQSFDGARFAAELEKPWDVVLFASESSWKVLSDANRQRLFERIREGLPVIFASPPGKAFKEEIAQAMGENTALDAAAITPAATGGLPYETLEYRLPFKLQAFELGKGKLVLWDGPNPFWLWSHAFVYPPNAKHTRAVDRNAIELYYAVAARIARWASGKTAGVVAEKPPTREEPWKLGEQGSLPIPFAKGIETGDELEWTLYSPFGVVLAEGKTAFEGTTAPCRFPLPQSGLLLLRWRAVRAGQTLDYGAARVPVESGVTLTGPTLDDADAIVENGKPVPFGWSLEGTAAAGDRLVAQLYDPDGRLMSRVSAEAAAGRAELPAWEARFVSHQLRLLLLRGDQVLDEKRSWLQVRPDRAADRAHYQVIVWGMEYGTLLEARRYQRLREVGINAYAPIGRNTGLGKTASEQGFRLVPTNVLVPKDGMDREKMADDFRKFVTDVRRYTPLGYSLADEPSGKVDAVDFRNWGAEMAHEIDPGAPVGFCGVWEGYDKDVPRFFGNCDFIEAYSPFHLYNANLWQGTERDLYRSFRRPDQLLTCWTHYRPWADHEPYSRTVPWLWLFEEFNGVSYFASGHQGMDFAILPGDLRLSHETRWWSQEVAEIQSGIGEQIIGMQRDHGAVRILYTPGATGASEWARALNETHIPYRFISHQELTATGAGEGVRLLIAPNLMETTGDELRQLSAFVQKGGLLLVTGPAGVVAENAASEGLQKLLGIRRSQAGAPSPEQWRKEAGALDHVSIQTDWHPGGPKAPAMEGATVGERDLAAEGSGKVLATITRVGEENADAPERPDFVETIFQLPAVIENRAGKGGSLYLSFQPGLESLKAALPLWCQAAGITPPAAAVHLADGRDDTVYLFPFSQGPVRLLGIVSDYIKRDPVSELDDEKTRLYYHHGKQLWKEENATVHLAAPAHCYNVRTGRYLGHLAEIPFTVRPGHPDLFAMLPYQVASVEVALPAQAQAGTTLEAAIRLQTQGGSPGEHVVALSLIAPGGEVAAADRFRVRTRSGAGRVRFSLPANAKPGPWQVEVRDAITGVSHRQPLAITAAPAAFPALVPERVQVSQKPVDWPEGNPKPYVAGETGAKVSLNRLKPSLGRDKEGNTIVQWHTKFTLSNPLIQYGLVYNASGLPGQTGDERPIEITAPYPPGLGFNRPNGSQWYYNGYLVVYFDDEMMGNYGITDIREVPAGENARAVVTWETPKAKIDLSFLIMPDHTGIFQELKVYDVREPIANLKIAFRSYHWGLKKGDASKDGFVTTNPSGPLTWVVMGNKVNEPAYGKGTGACALYILPEEYDEVKFGGYGKTELQKTVNLQPGGSTRVRWALWMFPDLSNARVLETMNSEEASGNTRDRLLKVFDAPAGGK